MPMLMTAPDDRVWSTPGCIFLPFTVVPFAENRSTTCTSFAASTLSPADISQQARGTTRVPSRCINLGKNQVPAENLGTSELSRKQSYSIE